MSLNPNLADPTPHEYGEGAFSIATGFGIIRPYLDTGVTAHYMRAREHAVRDHMLRTLYPEIDLDILSKTTAGRAAAVLVKTVSMPATEDSLFIGDRQQGITFVNPQRIIDESPTRFTPALGAFIADYTRAVTGLE